MGYKKDGHTPAHENTEINIGELQYPGALTVTSIQRRQRRRKIRPLFSLQNTNPPRNFYRQSNPISVLTCLREPRVRQSASCGASLLATRETWVVEGHNMVPPTPYATTVILRRSLWGRNKYYPFSFQPTTPRECCTGPSTSSILYPCTSINRRWPDLT